MAIALVVDKFEIMAVPYPVPVNEAERLRTLRSYKILDTKPEERFDELTRLAALICGVPISLISLIDTDRQWFKSRFGLDVEETPRAQAFCTHAIMQPEMFVVPDAMKDERFAHNPLVTGDLHIRFYAGAPLAARDGHLLGTLCVIDHKPHTLTEAQKEALKIVGRLVIANFELRRDLQELRDALAARDAAEGPSGALPANLDEIISGCREWLQTCRRYAREGGTKENLPLVAEFPSNEVLAIIADKLSKAGWSYGYISALDRNGPHNLDCRRAPRRREAFRGASG